jgi:hypothetical protein
MNTKAVIILLLSFLLSLNISAQISTGELPVSFKFDDTLFRDGGKSTKSISMPDMDAVRVSYWNRFTGRIVTTS